MLRGLVIVIMALDHVRDYFMIGSALDPAADPNVAAPLFFTRWITHFCAPVFVCLAGVSAGLMASRKTPRTLGWFLLTRGLWLVVIEWLVISTGFTFAPWGIQQIGGLVGVPMQVIWAIGASMLILAGAQFLGARVCLALGAVMVLAHNGLDAVWPMTDGPLDTAHPWWVALHAQMAIVAPPFFFALVYPVPPWAGVMLLGYGAAALFREPPARRDRRLLIGGVIATVAFIVVRFVGLYGDPNGWEGHTSVVGTAIDFFNVTKYPPSLLYLLMTLGPPAILLALADRLPAAISRVFIIYGRAPLAFYVVHFYVIHTLSILLGMVQGFSAAQFLTLSFFFPMGYGLPLPGVYIVWLLVVVSLYPWCRWVAAVKARRTDWWLSYL